ncbi:MAG: hypothetical protein R3F01_07715 [Lysobacteraceae bacterium]
MKAWPIPRPSVDGLATTTLGSRHSRAQVLADRPPLDLRAFVLVGLGSAGAYAVSHILRAASIGSRSEPVAGVALGAAAGTLALVLVNRRQLAPLRRRIAAPPRPTPVSAASGDRPGADDPVAGLHPRLGRRADHHAHAAAGCCRPACGRCATAKASACRSCWACWSRLAASA